MGNIHVKLFEIWTSGSGAVFYRKSLRMQEGRAMDTRLIPYPANFTCPENVVCLIGLLHN